MKHLLIVSVLFFLTTGCSSQIKKETEQATSSVQSDLEKTIEENDEALTISDSVNDDELYLGSTFVPAKPKAVLPEVMRETYIHNNPDSVSLAALFANLNETMGLRVYVTADAEQFLASSSLTDASTVIQTADSTFTSATADGGGSVLRSYTVRMRHEGTVQSFLDKLAINTNTFWRWNGEYVVYYRLQRIPYTLAAYPGTSTFDSSISTEAGDANASESNVNNNISSDFWSEIQDTVGEMVGDGSTVSISQLTGDVVVSATPVEHIEVSNYIDRLNQDLSKQVAIRVDIIEVEAVNASSFGLDLRTAFNDGTTSIVTDTGFFGATNSTPGLTWGIVDATDDFNGTEGFIKSLSQNNRVSIKSRNFMRTASGQVVATNVTLTEEYPQNTTTTITDGGTVVTSSETETATSGYRFQIYPKMRNNREIMLQVATIISGQPAFDEIVSGGNTERFASQPSKEFLNRARMNVGDTLVLTGFRSDLNNSDFQGVGEDGSPLSLLGQSDDNSKNYSETLILITPILERT